MRTAYFDCFAGISGDLAVGALIEIGGCLEVIKRELSKITLPLTEITAEPVIRAGLAATKFSVRSDERGLVRTWTNIRELLEESGLDDDVKSRSISIFARLAAAEAKIHRKSLDAVHFHEVGAADAIVDVVSACIALKSLKIEEVVASPIATGFGLAKSEHGLVPLPAPAAAEMLVGVPCYSGNVQSELVTPTGAAILTSIADSYGEMPTMVLEGVGYGAGSRELDFPNVLRVFVGKRASPTEDVVLVETTVDSADGELLSHVMDRLFEAGALDAWFSPVFMKKGRPGVALTALARPGQEEDLGSVLLREGLTLGVRYSMRRRLTAEREIVDVKTAWGKIEVKVARYGGVIVSVRPEHESCRQVSLKSGLPLIEVRRLATEEARRLLYSE